MRYTVRANKVKENERNIRGFASIVLGDAFKITNIAVLENTEKGQLFVSMPRYRGIEKGSNNTVYKDICNPITREFREELCGNILDAYEHCDVHENVYGTGKEELPPFSVQVTLLERGDRNIRGLARIYFDDNFVVNNVSLLQGKSGVYIAMPSYKTKKEDENGRPVYQDICYPVTKEFRDKLYGEIMRAYEQELQKKKDTDREKEGKKIDSYSKGSSHAHR